MSASGIDSVQAIVLALQMIGADIYSSSHHKSGKLMFDARGAATDFWFRAACGTCWSGMTGFMARSARLGRYPFQRNPESPAKNGAEKSKPLGCRHARPSAGHPRLGWKAARKDVDGRDKHGHDVYRVT